MDEFKEQRSVRKRKRETPEEENINMDTELTSSTTQFPQINPSELQVKIDFDEIKNNLFFI
jgi:hypothetical protein